MWTTEKIFNRETFEAWLASQPGDRGFEYLDNSGCLLCGFIAETTNAPELLMGGITVTLMPDYTNLPIPQWAIDLLWHARFGRGTFIRCDYVRETYQKLFGIDVCAEYPAGEVIQEPAKQPAIHQGER